MNEEKLGVFVLIYTPSGHILFLERTDPVERPYYPTGALDLPGGTTEPAPTDMTDLCTLVREAEEEAGVTFDLNRVKPVGVFKEARYYAYPVTEEEAKSFGLNTASTEHREFVWVGLEDLERFKALRHDGNPEHRVIIAKHADVAAIFLLELFGDQAELQERFRELRPGIDNDLKVTPNGGIGKHFEYVQKSR